MARRHFFSLLAAVAILFASASISYTRFSSGPLYIDEITYARLGYSLMMGHLASDSSFYSLYQQLGLTTNIQTPYGTTASVEPWLDHPPLMGLLLVPVLAFGLQPRLLPIVLFNLTGLALYLLLFQKNQNKLAWSTLFAFVLYGQYYVLPSMLFLDSGVSFFLILTVVFTLLYAKSRSPIFLYLAALSAALSTLSKEQGVASILYLALFSLYDARLRKGKSFTYLKAILLAVGISSTWVIFGLIVQPTLFTDLVSINLGRSVVSNNQIQGTIGTLVAGVFFQQGSITHTGIDYSLVLS